MVIESFQYFHILSDGEVMNIPQISIVKTFSEQEEKKWNDL